MSSNRYYVDSLAYDFDMFMPKEKREDNIIELNRIKKVKQPQRDRRAAVSQRPAEKAQARSVKMALSRKLSIAAVVVFFLGIFCANIYLRVQITETSTRIDKTEAMLDKAKSENVNLEMQMENRVSYKNLEQSAETLGMQKAEKYQVNYITVNQEDKSEVLTDKEALTAQNNE